MPNYTVFIITVVLRFQECVSVIKLAVHRLNIKAVPSKIGLKDRRYSEVKKELETCIAECESLLDITWP